MKWFLYVLGGLLTVVGVVWILQGTDIIKGGLMGGQMLYAILGLVLAIVGVVLILAGNRRRRIAS